MKRSKWWLIGSVAVGLVMIPLTGCMGTPQSEGDIWAWDPETDEPLQDYSLGKVK